MSTVTRDVLETYVQEHFEAEVALDLDRTMASMADEPYWECVPLNFRANGRDAVREFYRRLMAGFFPRIRDFADMTTVLADDTAVLEHRIELELPDGSVRATYLVAIVQVNEQGVVSERGYFDENLADVFRVALGDFAAFPGVKPLVPVR